MANNALVIVESPTKANTITRFLGKGYTVMASNGHIRDLPNSADEIPKDLKKEAWARLGVNVENDFEPLYIIPAAKKDHVKQLRKAVKEADEIFLATDEDREGESISWHLLQALRPKGPVRRLVFHEITKEAIERSLEAAREVDQNLVQAQETRRIVDRLFGYEVSPLLWKKMLPKLSAGRVQSVAVRLLVERERARIRFRSAQFCGIKATFAKGADAFDAELTHVGGQRVATGKDFDPDTGTLKNEKAVFVLDRARADAVRAAVQSAAARVGSVEEKPYSTAPAAPFVTSTLQQEANRRLRLSARDTMRVAQELYEKGLITYMRTDSTTLSAEAVGAARSLIAREFGPEYVPAEARQYRTKVKNAQEAHEAIRPAGDQFAPPAQVHKDFGGVPGRLYEMIWRRTVASQMPNARGTNIAVKVAAADAEFRATGKTVEFAGFLRAYSQSPDALGGEAGDREKLLPKMAEGDGLAVNAAEVAERSTQPPPRFTEGTLIKELERLGIGRPSTWATIVDLVLSRQYAFKKDRTLVPTFIAMAVVGLLEKHFTTLCDYQFTAQLEDDLDAISRGEADRLSYLQGFYFGNGHAGLQRLVKAGESEIDPRDVCGVPLEANEEEGGLEVRIGRYGPFLTDGEQRASIPDDQEPDALTVVRAKELIIAANKEPEALGDDPATGKAVYLKDGRFGPYVQLGEGGDGEKPKMASLLANMQPSDVDLALALRLLSLPREIGKHPDDGEAVLAANGRFGPYVKWGSEMRSIPADGPSPLDIALEAAVELLKQPKGRRRAAEPKVLREVGKHPASGAELKVLSGRFGPYVTDGEINASLPRGTTPESLEIDAAVELLAARARRIAEGGGKRGAKKATKKTAKKATKKTAKKATKKAAKKKGTAKASSAGAKKAGGTKANAKST